MQLRVTSLRTIKNGNRRTAWTPAQLPSLALWLDAADASTITLNGSNVSQWNDKSGNGKNAIQPAGANQPTYSLTGLNNKPALYFGANKYLYFSGRAIDFGADRRTTIAVVVSTSTAGGMVLSQAGGIASGWSPGNFVYYFAATTGGVQTGNFFGRVQYGGGWVNGNINAVDGQPHIHVFLDGGLTTTPKEPYVDGTLSTKNTFAYADYSNRANQLYTMIGGGIANSGDGVKDLNGYIPEIICFNSAISTDDRQKLEGYLAWKWGLAANLPAGHPYKTTPPLV